MALKILFADPQSEKLQEAKAFFSDKGFEVLCAENGRDAQLIIHDNPLFASIVSLDLQNHSGQQVLNYIKMNHPSLKTIITLKEKSPYSEELDELKVKLQKIGVMDTVQEPYDLNNLNELLEGQQNFSHMISQLQKRDGQGAEENIDLSDENFSALRIDEFMSAKNVLFDVYIRLGQGKYIKILHAGDTFSNERILKYKEEKNITHLYFTAQDRKRYMEFCQFALDKMFKNNKVASSTKLQMTKNLSEKYIEEVYTQGLKPQLIEKGMEVANQTYQLIKNDNNLYKLLRKYSEFDPSSYSHAFLTSLFANMIIKQFQWQSEVTTQMIAMGCFLHDIGKLKLTPELISKLPQDMSAVELEEYQKHPEYGAELLAETGTIKESVQQIVLQHHEFSDGSGFPQALQGSKIFTMSKIVALANDFCDQMVQKNTSPVETLKGILTNQTSFKRYNSQVLEAFIKVFADPSKIK